VLQKYSENPKSTCPGFVPVWETHFSTSANPHAAAGKDDQERIADGHGVFDDNVSGDVQFSARARRADADVA